MELFNSGHNCAQSVLGAFADVLGMDTEQAFRVASSFGGGMAGMRHVCGTVTAMAMAAGLKYGPSDPSGKEERKTNYESVRMLSKEFTDEHGSIICRQLRGLEPGLPEGKSPKPCVEYVRTSAMLIEKHLMD